MSASTSSGGSGQAMSIAAQFGINLPGFQKQTNWAYPDVIKSTTLLKNVIKKRFHSKKTGKEERLLDILTYDVKKNINEERIEHIAIDRLKKQISINENVKTGVFSINVEANEGVLAERINYSLLDMLDRHQSNFNKEKVSKTRFFIEERIKETFKELEFAEENLKNFNTNNRQITNSPSLLLEQMRLSREVSVLTGVFTSLKQQLETAKIEEVKDSDYIIIVDPPSKAFSPVAPKKLFIILLSIVFSVLCSIIIVKLLSVSRADKIDLDNKKLIKKSKENLKKNLDELTPFLKRKYSIKK